MPVVKLIADSGATKAEWCVVGNGKPRKFETQGISPYFLSQEQIVELISQDLKPKLKNIPISEIHYYGTGCANPDNVRLVRKAIQKVFPDSTIQVSHDLLAAARACCGNTRGMVANLGTGSFCCYFDSRRIAKETPGIGYILGDEGSGAYLGKKVIQYYLYNTFDEDLRARFDFKYVTNRSELLENVYRKPFPNRYLAAFTMFLAENRGHYMIENIIEDGLNDFFFTHLCKYRETWRYPVHFVGSVAYGFRDVLEQLCGSYEFELGVVLKKPMAGLIEYHS
jgi:N-acetylglucosamine kinase-like BadF-type ATPase